ncbi:MAG: BrnT family toxin [Caldilinea sp. CFX5]|nr:BrnT family toxin [Caldilinea sp. CFX5]
MNSYRFWWDEQNIDHIADHGVEPIEAEQVIANASLIRKADRGKYIAYGQTYAGRYLMVVFARKDQRRLRVVTSRDMTPTEKRNLRK